MRELDPTRVRWLFVHTAAYRGDAGVEEIRRWHTDPPPNGRGWSDIGYHYVIRRDGTIEPGRSTRYVGAHVAGVNSRSIGVCCEGDGDHAPFTDAQMESLLAFCHAAMKDYTIPVEGVLGHREVNDLIDAGEVDGRWATDKTCPGVMVDMDEIRDRLRTPTILPTPETRTTDSGATDLT